MEGHIHRLATQRATGAGPVASLNPSQLGSLFKFSYAVESWEAPINPRLTRPMAVIGSPMRNQIYRTQTTFEICRAICALAGRIWLATGRGLGPRVMLLIQVKRAPSAR